MSDYQHISYRADNGVATLSLNSPDTLNAVHQKMRFELMDVVQKIEQDDTVRVVVFSGEGRAFCAGADLSEGMPGHDNFIQQCAAEWKPWLMAMHDSRKIYIAAVNGACAGIGTAAAMNCDLIMMAEDAYMYQAFAAIGLMPDGGANWLLVHKLGYQRAFEMAVNAGRLTAHECHEMGIANKVVAPEELMQEATAWAANLAKARAIGTSRYQATDASCNQHDLLGSD